MDVVFTICSNNYLAHAATLIQSWFKSHPATVGYVILVDEVSPLVDYNIIKPAKLLPLADIGINELPELVEKFNITELNTAVKPDVFIHLFKLHPASKIIYLDPDILVTSKFTDVFDALDNNDFVLTPHICYPIDDDKAPTDYHTLRTGIFNLGFIALKNSEQIQCFLLWWRHRVFKYGYCDLPANMFYDQLWANFIPVFYDNYFILKHAGYNMANWNFHERQLNQISNDEWIVNNQVELKFFHFSGYKFSMPESVGSYHSRFNFDSRPDLISIFKTYQAALIANGVEKISAVPCVYFEEHKRLRAERELAKHKSLPPVPLPIRVLRGALSVARRMVYDSKAS